MFVDQGSSHHMVKREDASRISLKSGLILGFGLLLASCASNTTPQKKASGTNKTLSRVDSKPPVEAEIVTKAKFKAGKAYGTASERIVRSALKPVPRGGGRAVVGKPYKINGRWYKPRRQPNYNKTGIASWYGPNFHGRKTANGEIYDQTALSAAHPTLPLPSYVKVTNLSNKRSVIVRVNDRGPFHKSRIIDLSYRTAELLGTRAGGLAKVKVKYVGPARVDGKDEKYLLASYKGPGSVEPSRVAARNKLLQYAGLSPNHELVHADLPAVTAPPPIASPNRYAEPLRSFAGSGHAPSPTPTIVSSQTSGSAISNQPLSLSPSASRGLEAPNVTPARLIKANPAAESGGAAYAARDVRSSHVNNVFSKVLKNEALNWKTDEVEHLHVGIFLDRNDALKIKDKLARFGAVNLSEHYVDGNPAIRIDLESNLPFAKIAIRQVLSKAIITK
ncbi:MAG: septal ring lytic transglycosylase RlpA family protein [Hyphomicrobiales bacterium]